MKKCFLTAIASMLVHAIIAQAIEQPATPRLMQRIKNSPVTMAHALTTACKKAGAFAYQRPIAVAVGATSSCGIAYGLYKLLYWYFHVPDAQYYRQAHDLSEQADYRYRDILRCVSSATDANDMAALARKQSTLNPSSTGNEASLLKLAQSNPLPYLATVERMQKTIRRLREYKHSLKKRTESRKSRKKQSAEELLLNRKMENLFKKIKTDQLGPMRTLQRILILHGSYFLLSDRIAAIRAQYDGSPNIPANFAQSNNSMFGFVVYAQRAARELNALKQALKPASEKYGTISKQATQIRTDLKRQLSFIQDTQTFKDQLNSKWWHDWRERVAMLSLLNQTNGYS